MPADLDLTVPATTRGLATALQTLETACAARAVAAELVSRARIIVEELFTNTVKYGYGGECDRPVRLSVDIDETLTVTFEDDAPPFDLTRWKPAANSNSPADRQPGQAGIPLVLGLSSKVAYLRLVECNRITIAIGPR